ncbi:hypothetical protein JCM10213_001310, partial [Rhodosporidiobolus nylandii]
ECWVSKSAPKSSLKIDASKCSMTCVDNGLNYCGGSGAMSLYKLSSSKSKRHFDGSHSEY